MEPEPGIRIVETALYLEKHKALVISDLHLGYEEALNRRGVLIPRFQFKDILERVEKIISTSLGIERVILNGDLKHEFGTITGQEWRELRKLFRHFAARGIKVVIVEGNHDVFISPVAQAEHVNVVKDLALGSILILHGDELPKKIPKGIKAIIIGHEHPAVGIREGGRVEKFKCFLKGSWKGKLLIVMPSFNPIVEGTDVLSEKTHSPFLKRGLGDFEVFVSGDEPMYFGKLKNLD